MNKRLALVVILGTLAPFMACHAQALQNAEQPADASKVLALYPGVAPGSETWTWKETVTPVGGSRRVRNVVQPTLTVFNPTNAARANGTAVIVAPGGGFVRLAVDMEGYEAARQLAALGYTAIVLKYRTRHTADTDEEYLREQARAPTAAPVAGPADRSPETNPGIADGPAAVRYVRAHAAELGVAPDRIGFLGFSAGGRLVNAAVVGSDDAARPNFAAQIYSGAADDVKWLPNTPPMFLAVAADDSLLDSVLSAFKTLTATRHAVELHVYNKAGHGFGMRHLGLTSDLWFDQFTAWMSSLGYGSRR
jgi:acetyl esterase/lipase